MKAQILKIAGVKSEKEFYKKFPTEAAFLKKHGKELAKLKKAQVGTMTQQDTSLTTNIRPIDFEDIKSDATSVFSPLKDKAMELGIDSMTTEEEREEKYREQLELAALENQAKPKKKGLLESLITPGNIDMAASLFSGGGGGGEGVTGSVEVGELEMGAPMGKKGKKVMKFEPHMMYDPKTGKGYKANKKADHERMSKLGYTHEKPKKAQDGVSFEPMDLGFEIPDTGGRSSNISIYDPNSGNYRRANKAGDDIAFGGKFADALKSAPVIGDIVEGIGKIKTQKDTLKDLKQMTAVSDIMLRAAQTRPEEIEREYVRPEDIQNTGEEFFPIYGVGTNVLAKNGGMFNNPGYVPLNNVNKTKNFQEGGDFPWQAVSDQASSLFFGDKSERDAGTAIGGGIGRAVGTAFFGPVGGAIGSFVGGGIGDLVDRNDRRQRMERKKIDKNVKELTYSQLGPAVQAGYASHMKDGGIVKNPDLKTVWGGKAKAVAYNPYAGGESIYFEGNSHDKKDPKTGQTGIGVAYGPQSVAANEAVVEVENEPAQILEDGGNQENLVIYGDLKIPKEYSEEIGDPDAGGKKFKHYVNNLNDEEARINKQMGTAVENAGDTENTKWGELVRSTSDAIINGGDMKLQNIANKKMILADLQEALNDTFKERGIDGNSFISKGEIKAVKDTEEYAKNGGKMETYTDYAEDGTKVKKLRKIEKELHKASKMHKSQAERIGKMVKAEDGAEIPKAQNSETLELNELPVKFKTKEEAIEAGYEEFPEGSGKFRKVKVEATEEVEGQDATGSDIGEMPANQKYDDRTGLAGGVTEADYEKLVKENPWFDWNNFDRRKKEDVKRFQREFNKRNKDAGIDVSLSVDGIIGQETASARFTEAVDPQDAQDPEYEYAEVEEDIVTTDTTTTLQLRTPFDADLLRRLFERDVDNDLDYNQILPEMTAASQNQLEPVYAQTFQPRLRVPYDISLQDQRNVVNSQYRAMAQNPLLANNPAALAAAQAPFFDALNSINAEQFRQNQAMKDTVYTGNLEAINNANILNMGIYDQQQERQAQAVANTKETNLEIAKSIADKYQKNKLENRREKVLRELYPNFRFGEDLDLFNQGSAVFNIPGQGPTGTGNPIIDILTGGGINPNAGKAANNEDESAFDADRADRKLNQFQRGLKAKAIYDYVYPPGMAAKKGMKLTPIKRAKKNQKNSNVVRQFRNMTYNNPLGK